jgi:putative cell wall-binding protein
MRARRRRCASVPFARVALLTTGETFPDALAAVPAAGMVCAPVLLVRHDSIPDAIAAEILRLRPTRIDIVGGTSAVTDELHRLANEGR